MEGVDALGDGLLEEMCSVGLASSGWDGSYVAVYCLGYLVHVHQGCGLGYEALAAWAVWCGVESLGELSLLAEGVVVYRKGIMVCVVDGVWGVLGDLGVVLLEEMT